MIVGIDHIGIAVNSIEDAVKVYTDALGLKVKEIETVEEQKVRTAIIPVGDCKIELLESTDSEGPIAKHIEKRGEGIHHLALKVSNNQGALETLAQVPLALGTRVRLGAGTGGDDTHQPRLPVAVRLL